MAEAYAASYDPCAPTRTCSGGFRLGFRLSSVHAYSLLYLPNNDMFNKFLPHPQMPYHSSMLPLVCVTRALHILIIANYKTKSNRSHGMEATFLKILHSCLIYRYRCEGRCLRFKTSISNHAMSFAN
jgi:hypothetical protein